MTDKTIQVLRNRKLSLEGSELIGTGAAGKVYRLPDGDVVKVLFSTDFEAAEREILLSKWAFVKGIPTAISYDVADVDGHPGLLYESLGRDNLRNHLRNHQGDLTELLAKYLSLIKTIDAILPEKGVLPSAKEKALEELRSITERLTDEEYEKSQALLHTIPEDGHVVHGDCHIKNIKMVDGQPFLIDLDTLSTGDPLFELSGLCCCYDAYAIKNVNASGFNDFFEMEQRLIAEAYHYILDHYFEGLSAGDRRENLSKIELLTWLHMLHELNPEDPADLPLYEEMYRRVRERLPRVNDLVLRR